jgi:hypothetical protein
MKYAEDRPYAHPEKAARRIMELAHAVEPVQDGRIHVEKINYPFRDKGSPAEYGAGRKLGDRARLAMDARERDLCEDYTCRSGAICLTVQFSPPRAKRLAYAFSSRKVVTRIMNIAPVRSDDRPTVIVLQSTSFCRLIAVVHGTSQRH